MKSRIIMHIAGPCSDMTKSFYYRHDIVPFDEDLYHEFKGHRSISMEELSPNTIVDGKRTRQHISKCLCGMLNNGKGGTIYSGVLDDGRVEGLMLTPAQKDHVLCVIADTFSRYQPAVPRHLYTVKFVPVVDRFDPQVVEVPNLQARKDLGHCLRTYKPCWCDNECAALFVRGYLSPFYVCELTVRPWNHNDPRNKPLIQNKKLPEKPPVFLAEDGNCYIRRNVTTACVSIDEVTQTI